MNRKLLIVLIVVLITGVGAGIGFAKLRKQATPPAAHQEVEAPGKPVQLEEFLVNLADTNQPHYLKTVVVLVVKDAPGVTHSVDEKTPQVRDAMITVMSQMTFSELLTPEGKTKLKKTIRSRVNKVIEADAVTDVYFTSFAMQ